MRRWITELAPPGWSDQALCAQTDPDVFFAEKGEGDRVRAAKQICFGCEVRPKCLEYAVANNERYGVWGGLTERERRVVRKQAS